jgi:hypothetical protein
VAPAKWCWVPAAPVMIFMTFVTQAGSLSGGGCVYHKNP